MSGALYKLVKEGGVGTFSKMSVFYHKGVPMYVYSNSMPLNPPFLWCWRTIVQVLVCAGGWWWWHSLISHAVARNKLLRRSDHLCPREWHTIISMGYMAVNSYLNSTSWWEVVTVQEIIIPHTHHKHICILQMACAYNVIWNSCVMISHKQHVVMS